MAIFNEFRFIGLCYGDAKAEIIDTEKRHRTTFTLVSKSSANKNKKVYIPMLAYGYLASRAAIFCRNGNLVAVNGEITSTEFFNRIEGSSQIQLYFLVSEIMLITKPYKKQLTDKDYQTIIELYDLEKGNK